ncbi:DEAD/DEAH box helicase family protein, partial [Flavobacteriaceae bacterium]|nr:DEAD/DEAH box helicase family protein [Flavobacteriaceae bacterium]
LENEDLGKAFYEMLTSKSGIRLIDFENFDNNDCKVVTELPCKKDDEEFRPDITLLINGMPLVFIEVKKPNNLEGIQAEHKRIRQRFENKKFRKFINITQFMVFTNNMEYDDGAITPIQGAFYSSTAYGETQFNYFREEEELDLQSILAPENEDVEIEILKDTNLLSIRNSPEFNTNKYLNTPTNRLSTSLFSKNRLSFILQYAIAFVKRSEGIQKHVMRYPQIFATKAIEQKIKEGIKSGIIWHTQGSGKTALAYYNVKHLTDYYQKTNVIPKFYFIVDRLDLLVQASIEFTDRGLVVHKINSRQEFADEIKSTEVIHNDSGNPEITVVNIQKFKDDPDVVKNTDYNLNIQRIYFMDEVHRSYNPKGSFLANLNDSDKNAIKIGLTGTPLLGSNYNSRSLFGNYIHKYFYNSSIADGYTLRLIREEIETSYKMKLKDALKEISVLEGNVDKKKLYSHSKFVEPMLKYIVDDFELTRITTNDNSIGGMVVCDSADQAKKMYEIFQSTYSIDDELNQENLELSYSELQIKERKIKKAAVILYDIGTKQDRKDWVSEFKDGKIDLLFVYNMLLTGFDAPRLKKLYIGRVIKAHNLLQTLTRVNRTYKEFNYGYIVDFAGIEDQFKKTSQDYFNELQSELGDELESYSNLFLSEEEIVKQIDEIQDILFHYDTINAENFSAQVSEISDRTKMLVITKALNNSQSLYNLIRLSGKYELLERLDFKKLSLLTKEANNHLALINTKEALENNVDTGNLLNVALEDVIFKFTKLGQEEIVLADKLRSRLKRTREKLAGNFDPKDPVFVTLKEELERLFKKKNLAEIEPDEMNENIEILDKIYDKASELDRENRLLQAKYENDKKYARLHKRLTEKDPLTDSEEKLFKALSSLKKAVDEQILMNTSLLNNEKYAEKMILKLVYEELNTNHNIELDAKRTKEINALLVKEYLNEFNGIAA